MSESKASKDRLLLTLFVVLLFGLVLVMNFSRVVRKDYSHDEDQFIASAWLTAESGLLPYRDYAYFHAPYLVFVYAALFRLASETPLFSARIFSILSGSAGIFVVFFLVKDFFHGQPGRTGFFIAAGVTLLYLLNPLTAAASGLSWNHEAMVLLMLLAFWLAWHAQDAAHPWRWLFASGLIFALAAGVRSSAITALPPYLIVAWYFPEKRSFKNYVRWLLSWVSGLVTGLLPMLVLFLLAPRQFIFGNIEYAVLNTRFRVDTPVLYDGSVAVYGPSTPMEKLAFLLEEILSQPANLLVLLLLALFGWTVLVALARKGQLSQYHAVLLLLLVPFAAAGSFLPSPSWVQYFFVPLPFALLGAAYGLAALTRSGTGPVKWLLVLLMWVIVFTHIFQFQEYRRLGFLRYPELWRPQAVHRVSQQIRDLVGEQGRVFTLSPLYLVEAGLPLDPHFVTGAFAYRTGVLLDAQQRQFYGIISEDDLESYLDENPPDAIFLGLELFLDEKIQQYAVNRGYVKKELAPTLSLWVNPR